MKKKPSNNKNSYYLIDDSTEITDYKPPNLTITNTPIVKRNLNLSNPLNSVPDQIKTEPDTNEFSDTLDVIQKYQIPKSKESC